MKISVRRMLLATALSLSATTAAQAGPYGDDFSRCLIESSTITDQGTLVKWIFSVASLHPEVAGISALTEAERGKLTQTAADLFTDLITNRCKDKAVLAVKYEGPTVFATSFEVLGQAAMIALFSDPKVMQGLADLDSHYDKQKFEAVFGKPATQ